MQTAIRLFEYQEMRITTYHQLSKGTIEHIYYWKHGLGPSFHWSLSVNVLFGEGCQTMSDCSHLRPKHHTCDFTGLSTIICSRLQVFLILLCEHWSINGSDPSQNLGYENVDAHTTDLGLKRFALQPISRPPLPWVQYTIKRKPSLVILRWKNHRNYHKQPSCCIEKPMGLSLTCFPIIFCDFLLCDLFLCLFL